MRPLQSPHNPTDPERSRGITRQDAFRPRRAALAWGVAASVSGHVAIAMLLASPLLWGASGSVHSWTSPSMDDRAREDEERVRLGIERSRAVTLTWLGFEEPEPHFAPLSETEQAAMTPTPGSPGEPGTPGLPAPSPSPSPTELAEAAPPEARPSESAPAETPEEGAGEATAAVPIEPDAHFLDADILLPTAKPSPALRQPAARPSDNPEPERESPETPPAPATPPVPSGGGGGGEGGEPGEPSDRASDAVSNEPTLVVEPGRPAAAEGLEILTDHIRWRRVDQHLAMPRNPTIAITFGPDGRPSLVEFVPDARGIRQSTGHRNVDETLINGVYRWRAQGARIDHLRRHGGPEVRIVLRILLVPER